MPRSKTPSIPFEFKNDENDYFGFLEISEDRGIATIGCSDIPGHIYLPAREDYEYPEPDEVKRHTPDFHFYPHMGFSLGKYSEFLVFEPYGQRVDYLATHIGDVELTLERVTPICQYLLDTFHDHHYPEWNDLHSLRLLGPSATKVEAYLACAFVELHRRVRFKFDLFSLGEFEDPDGPDGRGEDKVVLDSRPLSPAVIDIEPLRFYYKALNEKEDSNAFIQFYRVIEFYAFLQYQDEIAGLRQNRELNSRSFILELQKILGKDERGPILRLIVSTAMRRLLPRPRQKGSWISQVRLLLAVLCMTSGMHLFTVSTINAQLFCLIQSLARTLPPRSGGPSSKK